MLRTALIGFPSSGKTTLFQLMTSQREAPRAGHGKLEAVVGVARVPDERVERLAELYKPRKKTPRDGRVRGHRGGRAERARRRCSTWSRSATRTRSCTSCAPSATRR